MFAVPSVQNVECRPGEGRHPRNSRIAWRPRGVRPNVSPAPDDGSTAAVPAVLYGAKSTEDVHGSIPAQLAECRAAAEAEDRIVVAEYHDEAASAFSGNRGRGLADARALAERLVAQHGAVELWVWHSDRLARGDGRTAAHLVEHVLWAIKSGITIRSVQDDDACRDLLYAAVNGQRNHEDSKRKSAATQAGKQRRFKAGNAVGGPINDGYRLVPVLNDDGTVHLSRDGRVVQRRERDPERAPLIERMFDLVEQGHSFGDVSRLLNGERAVTRRGKRWTTRAVRAIVTNPYYAGWIVMHAERAEGTHTPLIDRDRWQRIQDGLRRLDPAAAQRRKGGRRPADEYLLRGIGFCGRCNETLYTKRYAAGRAYICRNVRECTGLCDAPPIPADRIEPGVLSHIDDLIPGLEDWIATKVAERNEERDRFAAIVNNERTRLHEIHRDAELMRDQWVRHLHAGADDLADVALREMRTAEHDAEEQRQAIAAAETRLAEWTTTPNTFDAALDFFTQVRDAIYGRIKAAEGVIALRAALSELLTGMWADVDGADTVRAKIVLRTDNEDVPAAIGMLLAPSLPRSGDGWPEFMADALAERSAQTERDTFV